MWDYVSCCQGKQFPCIWFLIAYYLKLKMMFAVANRMTFDQVFYVDYEKFKGNIF